MTAQGPLKELDMNVPAEAVKAHFTREPVSLASLLSRVKQLERCSTAVSIKHVLGVASQALLFAAGEQPRGDLPSQRFRQMALEQDSRLEQVLQRAGLPRTAQAGPLQDMGAQLDEILSARNNTVHYRSAASMAAAVQDAMDNYVTDAVRRQQPEAVWALENFPIIREQFSF